MTTNLSQPTTEVTSVHTLEFTHQHQYLIIYRGVAGPLTINHFIAHLLLTVPVKEF